ncbi:penicillin acylase family protein [Streptosporangium longisporum]|uniref:Penicillin acylase family protein n=1 Tax=Streptosporangium longisporum TaxID=46187 RepID=A0ABN3XQK1_9ACTN
MRGKRGRLWRMARWGLALVLVLALTGAALAVWTVRRAFPAYEGTLTLSGLSAPVTVHRDGYGVPQIHARTEADLFKAQGYVTAQDRFWEMDFRRHLASGRMSEMFGASQVGTDAFLRTLGWRRVAEQEWRLISPEARGHLRAYADGVNAWIAGNGGAAATGGKSLEYTVLGLQNDGYTVAPWDPIDSIAWLKAMAWDLRSNLSAEIGRASLLAHGLTREEIAQLFPPYPYDRNRPIVDDGAVKATAEAGAGAVPSRRVLRKAGPALAALKTLKALPGLLGSGGPGIGSNSWVVGGALTASGKPLLANDPHLGSSQPNVWYQVGLRCECRLNVQGFSLSGLPGVMIGHNDRVAWGLTNLAPDVTDLYLEKLDGERYFDGTGWRDLTTRQEVIKVAGGAAVPLTVRSTKHGPLLSDRSAELFGIARHQAVPTPAPSLDVEAPGVPAAAARGPYGVALRWTALTPGRTVEAIFALNRAANWGEFRAAAALFEVPSQNLVYADVDGNIGYQAPGRVPVRGKGNGQWPALGWDPAYDWTGYVPFAELPQRFNPPGGVIVTANQAVTGPKRGPFLTDDWSYGYRSQRVLDMITERASRGRLDLGDMREMQFDNRNGFAPELVPSLLAAEGVTGAAARARELMRGWDFQQPADSAAAAFYNASLRHLLLRTFDEVPDGQKPASGDGSWEILRPLLGEPSSPWWDDRTTPGVESMNDMLVTAMNTATSELNGLLGDEPLEWRWGDLHTLTLRNATFGESGIAPIEWLFNLGPVATAGGADLVNATGWTPERGYEVDFVPSMRMIVDLADLDGSAWIQLSGNSGHAFHPHYGDQLELWRTGRTAPMRWSRDRVRTEAEHTLTLVP